MKFLHTRAQNNADNSRKHNSGKTKIVNENLKSGVRFYKEQVDSAKRNTQKAHIKMRYKQNSDTFKQIYNSSRLFKLKHVAWFYPN